MEAPALARLRKNFGCLGTEMRHFDISSQECQSGGSLFPQLDILLDCLRDSVQTLGSCGCVSRGQGGERMGAAELVAKLLGDLAS